MFTIIIFLVSGNSIPILVYSHSIRSIRSKQKQATNMTILQKLDTESIWICWKMCRSVIWPDFGIKSKN